MDDRDSSGAGCVSDDCPDTNVGPPLERLPELVDALATEVDRVLGLDRWVMLVDASATNHHMHAAAALRHVVALLGDVCAAVVDGREVAIRVLGRAHVEAWLIGMYVTLDGEAAIAKVAAGYVEGIEGQDRRLAAYDIAVQRYATERARRNEDIRQRNAGIAAHNERHPNDARPLLEELPESVATPVGSNLSAAVASADVSGERLVLSAVVDRLNKLALDLEGVDRAFALAYDLAYRGLSNVGAHPTLWALNAYLDFTPRSAMVRTVPTMQAGSFGLAVLRVAVMHTALLASKVFALRDTPSDVVVDTMALYDIA